MNEAIRLFSEVYLPNVEGATVTYDQWRKQQPGEYQKWVEFRDALLAASSPDDFPAPPQMKTRKAKELVAAAELAMQFFVKIEFQQV